MWCLCCNTPFSNWVEKYIPKNLLSNVIPFFSLIFSDPFVCRRGSIWLESVDRSDSVMRIRGSANRSLCRTKLPFFSFFFLYLKNIIYGIFYYYYYLLLFLMLFKARLPFKATPVGSRDLASDLIWSDSQLSFSFSTWLYLLVVEEEEEE